MPDDVITGPIGTISSAFRSGPSFPTAGYRALSAGERRALEAGGNRAEDWDRVLVSEEAFDPSLVSGCEFLGDVRIGALAPGWIAHHDLRLPVGLSRSTIADCSIGASVALRNVSYLAHYEIGDRCILFDVDEMLCTGHAKFGNGLLWEGEDEDSRIWIELRNENGGRRILPFEGLIPADAWIWSKYREDGELMAALVSLTESHCALARGSRGSVGERTVIKDARIIKDVRIGSRAYIKGANKLKNLTILSSPLEPTQIGEGVELVNGIVGQSNRIFYEAKAIRFVTGRNVQLKYGARLLNSVLGDNSTVSCCELLNNLIFPFHEQHHNNSFLIASAVLGQSNIAAGATIGSNHNSRAPDGEILAGRGFWPGLCTSFKHDSRFASYCLVAKGSYGRELDIPYPFALVSLREGEEAVRVTPAWWFAHNMYAMARNSWKFAARDRRKVRVQRIETDYLAPDAAQEALAALGRLERLAAEAGVPPLSDAAAADEPLRDPLLQKGIGGIVEKPRRAWALYRAFLLHFGVKALLDFSGRAAASGRAGFREAARALASDAPALSWVNCGGQLMAAEDVEALKADIKAGRLSGWDDVHRRYDGIDASYARKKAVFGLHAIERVLGAPLSSLDDVGLSALLASVAGSVRGIHAAALSSRRKDFEDPYRKLCYDSEAEMRAVRGSLEENDFLPDLERRCSSFASLLESIAASA